MSISAALSNIAKYVFPNDLPHAFYDMNPLLGDVKKVTNDVGESYRYTVATSQGAVGSADYNTAYAVAGNVQYTRFTLTRVTDYALARMNGEDYEALQSDAGAVVGAWKDRVDTAYEEAKRSLAINLFGNGSGARGNVSGYAANQITLSEPTTSSNFYVGMWLVGAATATGALRAGAGEVLAKINRATGLMTATDADWATGINGIANGDFLFRKGDAQNNGGVAKVITGIGELLSGNTTTIWGGDRSVDPVALAGQSQSYATFDMAEAVLDLAMRVSVQNTERKVMYANPRDKVEVVKLLEARARFVRPAQGDQAKVGFDNIEFSTDSGPMTLKGDVNCPRYSFFITPPERIELRSVGPAPKPLKVDGQLVRARDAFDAYEMRIGSYVAVAHRFPGAGGQGTSWGK